MKIKNKFLASVAAIGLLAGALIGTTAPAFATPDSGPAIEIDASISCITSTYRYEVTWTVKNTDPIQAATITVSSDTVLVPETTTVIPANSTSSFTEQFDAPGDKTLTLSASWPDSSVGGNSFSLEAKKFPTKDCEPNPVDVYICHATPPATAAQGWNYIKVDDDAIFNDNPNTENDGHNSHDLDIIPAFVYWEQVDGVWTQKSYPGKNLTSPFNGFTGQQILDAKCDMVATPAVPTFAPAVCTGNGVAGDGSYTIPTTAGVVYSVRLNNTGSYLVKGVGTYPIPVGTFVEIIAEASPEWIKLVGTAYWSYTVLSPGTCIITTPTTATFENGECTEEGVLVLGQFFIPTKTGVQYSVSIKGSSFADYSGGYYDAPNGALVVVKATALPTYTLGGTTEWSHTFSTPFCPPVLADYEVFMTPANQVCSPEGGTTSGSITVSVIAGPPENPVPAVFILNKGLASEQVITGTTLLPPGNYTVTADAKLAADGVYSSTGEAQPDGTWLWEVTIAAASAFACLELPVLALTTLALTGSTASYLGWTVGGGALFLGFALLLVRRRREAASE